MLRFHMFEGEIESEVEEYHEGYLTDDDVNRILYGRSVPLSKHPVTGQLVSARNKSGSGECSTAASQWRTGNTTSTTFTTLAKCRAMAGAHKQAGAQRAAGNEAKAQVLEARAVSGKVGVGNRKNLAAQLKAARAKKQAAPGVIEHPAHPPIQSAPVDHGPTLREQVEKRRAAKGTRADRLDNLASQATAHHELIALDQGAKSKAYQSAIKRAIRIKRAADKERPELSPREAIALRQADTERFNEAMATTPKKAIKLKPTTEAHKEARDAVGRALESRSAAESANREPGLDPERKGVFFKIAEKKYREAQGPMREVRKEQQRTKALNTPQPSRSSEESTGAAGPSRTDTPDSFDLNPVVNPKAAGKEIGPNASKTPAKPRAAAPTPAAPASPSPSPRAPHPLDPHAQSIADATKRLASPSGRAWISDVREAHPHLSRGEFDAALAHASDIGLAHPYGLDDPNGFGVRGTTKDPARAARDKAGVWNTPSGEGRHLIRAGERSSIAPASTTPPAATPAPSRAPAKPKKGLKTADTRTPLDIYHQGMAHRELREALDAPNVAASRKSSVDDFMDRFKGRDRETKAALSLVNGRWDDVSKDIDRGRLSRGEVEGIIDHGVSTGAIHPDQAKTIKGRLPNGAAAKPAAAPAPPAAPAPSATHDLPTFAARVKDIANGVGPEGRFHDNKVFISHAHEAYEKKHGKMPIDEFKSNLLAANNQRHLNLSRADMVSAMDPEKVKASETAFGQGASGYGGNSFHFILNEKPSDKPAVDWKALADKAKTEYRAKQAETLKGARKSGAVPAGRGGVLNAAHEMGSRHYGDVLGASNMVRTKKDITGNVTDESIRKIRRKQREILLAKLMAKRQAQR